MGRRSLSCRGYCSSRPVPARRQSGNGPSTGSGDGRSIRPVHSIEALMTSRLHRLVSRRLPPGRGFRPLAIWTHRRRLMQAQVRRIDGCDHEVLRRHRTAREPTEHRQLAGMRHRIGERPLEQPLRRGMTPSIATPPIAL